MKTTPIFLKQHAAEVLQSTAMYGNIHTAYAAGRNLKLIQDALDPVFKAFRSDPVKCFLENRQIEGDVVTPPHDWEEGDERRQLFETGKEKFKDLLNQEIDFVGYKFDMSRIGLVSSPEVPDGGQPLESQLAVLLVELNLAEDA